MNNIIGSNDIVYNKWYKPVDWTDIQTSAVDNSINLLVGTTSEFETAGDYDNLGFKVTCVGGYDVYIDGELFGQYASEEQCNITWSSYSATSGTVVTYPRELVTHKIVIKPTVAGTSITAFPYRFVQAANESQGCLWEHYAITNQISGYRPFASAKQPLLEIITAKNNSLGLATAQYFLGINAGDSNIKYLPLLQCLTNSTFHNYIGKYLYFSNMIMASEMSYTFFNCINLEKIDILNLNLTNITTFYRCHSDNRNLKLIPNYDFTYATNMAEFITNAEQLDVFTLDLSASTALTTLGVFGSTTYFISGLKGLVVSSSAPFNNITAPQINVSYTGLDRNALIALFNSLPTISNGQKINIVGCTGTSELTDPDKAIAINKGWELME